MNLEYREFPVEELRFSHESDKIKTLRGYAAVFGKLSEELGGFREKIAPGAFAKTLIKADVRLLINHKDLPLARTKSGTLLLSEDENGLRFEAGLDATDPDVQRLIPKMERGDLNQMSIGFFTISDKWEHPAEQKAGGSIRTLLEVELCDISVVTFPAYPQTSVNIRSTKDVYDSYLTSLRAQEDVIKIGLRRAQEAHRERLIKIRGYIV